MDDCAGQLLKVWRIFCGKCDTAEFIYGETIAGVDLEAEEKGWRMSHKNGWSWLCPACVAKHEGVHP